MVVLGWVLPVDDGVSLAVVLDTGAEVEIVLGSGHWFLKGKMILWTTHVKVELFVVE